MLIFTKICIKRFKSALNVLYGKMLENKRSHANIEVVNSKKRFLNLVTKGTLSNFMHFNEGSDVMHLKQVTLNSPIFVSMISLSQIKEGSF